MRVLDLGVGPIPGNLVLVCEAAGWRCGEARGVDASAMAVL